MTFKSNYKPEIDGLRAFAVIAVIINHFNNDLLPSGYLGVDIFFAISGYVITASLARRENKNFISFITSFYERRIQRLVPALFIFVVILSILILIFNSEPTISIRTGASSLFGLSNLYLLRHSTDYFGQESELNPFTHTWSLGIEEQFYFIFPFLIWFTGFAQKSHNGKKILISTLLFLSALSYFSFIYLYGVNQPSAYFLMPARFWEIALGSLVFLIPKNIFLIKNYLKHIDVVLVFMIFIVLLLPKSLATFTTTLIVFFTIALIYIISENSIIYNLLTKDFIVLIGKASYSLYLWHWGVLCISLWTIGVYWWTLPIQFLIITLLSAFSYKFVEYPLRHKVWFEFNIKSLVKLIGLFVLTISIQLGLDRYFHNQFFNVGHSIYPWQFKPYNWLAKEPDCFTNTQEPDSAIYTRCSTESSNKNDRNIYILGDSHAFNLLKILKKTLPEFNKNLQYINYNIIGYSAFVHRVGVDCPECLTKQELNTISYLEAKLKPNDIIIYSMSRNRIINDGMDFQLQQNYPRQENESLLDSIENRIEKINNLVKYKNAKLLMVDDLPNPRICDIDSLRFLYAHRGPDRVNCDFSRESSIDDRMPLTNIYKKYTDNKNNIYIDLHDILCPGSDCSLYMKIDSKSYFLYTDLSPHLREDLPQNLYNQISNKITSRF